MAEEMRKLRRIHDLRGPNREILCDAPLFAVKRLVGDQTSEGVYWVPFCMKCDSVVNCTEAAFTAFDPHDSPFNREE